MLALFFFRLAERLPGPPVLELFVIVPAVVAYVLLFFIIGLTLALAAVLCAETFFTGPANKARGSLKR